MIVSLLGSQEAKGLEFLPAPFVRQCGDVFERPGPYMSDGRKVTIWGKRKRSAMPAMVAIRKG